MNILVGVMRNGEFRCNDCIDFSSYDSGVWFSPGDDMPSCQYCGTRWQKSLGPVSGLQRALVTAKLHGWTVQLHTADHNTTGVLFTRDEEQMTSEWVTTTGQLDWADYIAPRDPEGIFTTRFTAVYELLRSIPASAPFFHSPKVSMP